MKVSFRLRVDDDGRSGIPPSRPRLSGENDEEDDDNDDDDGDGDGGDNDASLEEAVEGDAEVPTDAVDEGDGAGDPEGEAGREANNNKDEVVGGEGFSTDVILSLLLSLDEGYVSLGFSSSSG